MAQQPQQLIVPTIYALLPPASYNRFISQLSLQALHAAPYTVRDDLYNPTNTVLPQPRTLRLRARRRSADSPSSVKGKEKEVVVHNEDEEWDYDVNYVSGLMNASEYRDMEVRSFVGLDILGDKSRSDIEGFLEAMDFRRVLLLCSLPLRLSHSYTRSGLVFHLPTPLMLLHLTVTRLHPDIDTPPLENSSEPYLVQLEPSRPIPSQPTRGEPAALDVMGAMRDLTGRIDGLYWSTGR